METHVVYSRRLLPTPADGVSKTLCLSIVDATCVKLSTCGAVWYFDPPSSSVTTASTTKPVSELENSLQRVLRLYPQWCGAVRFVEHEYPSLDHNRREGRVVVTFGSPADPGVEFVYAESTRVLSEVIPDAQSRRTHLKNWDASALKSSELISKVQLAPRSTDQNAPAMVIQVTAFACGGTAVAVGLSHCLSDAQSLYTFMKTWSDMHRGTRNIVLPIFELAILDGMAGNIDCLTPDAHLVQTARSLPCNRFDTMLDAGGPSWSYTKPPQGVDHTQFSPGDPQPFEDWDLSLPVSSYLLHFSADELAAIWQAACGESRGSISRHDALVVHVWILINRARFPDGGDEIHAHLDISFGLRARLLPSLPKQFLGSPIMVADVSLPVSALTSELPEPKRAATLVNTAAKVRSTLSRFDNSSIRALLHDAAHEPCAQRLWQSFLGRRHTILTSWVQLDLYSIGFDIGDCRFVDPILPDMDGIVEVMEAKPMGINAFAAGEEYENGKKHWSDGGVDVSIRIERDAMERLLVDPLLRAYVGS